MVFEPILSFEVKVSSDSCATTAYSVRGAAGVRRARLLRDSGAERGSASAPAPYFTQGFEEERECASHRRPLSGPPLSLSGN